ncbi:hypothetical protein M407DRAFT_228811 [Tulasnella calospora MUT 4182]|uniref:Uncharacterized protein n=1 Tax=Tulasnella calospora MUT 4182 TaxID=1051891 RepID=A0A0C3PRL1_9AGAM|nr:hypothetical protein M407DRAFT_228811 [Tulasnella calospora MUT 4182]
MDDEFVREIPPKLVGAAGNDVGVDEGETSDGKCGRNPESRTPVLGSLDGAVGEVDEVGGAGGRPFNAADCSAYGTGLRCLKLLRPSHESPARHSRDTYKLLENPGPNSFQGRVSGHRESTGRQGREGRATGGREG